MRHSAVSWDEGASASACRVSRGRAVSCDHTAAQQAASAGRSDARATLAAQALNRSDLLAEFALTDAPEFDGWMAVVREWPHVQVLEALALLRRLPNGTAIRHGAGLYPQTVGPRWPARSHPSHSRPAGGCTNWAWS